MGRLVRWLAVLALVAWGPVFVQPAGAQPAVSEADRAAIIATIEGQIAAFRRDDEAAAFAFASPMIQGMFETEARFMAMVRTLYPPVYRPRLVLFGVLEEVEGRLVQKVELIGPDGAAALALYTMIPGQDGWRINGVVLTASEKLAA